jgi:hypothetical protein
MEIVADSVRFMGGGKGNGSGAGASHSEETVPEETTELEPF